MHKDRCFSSNASIPKERWDEVFGLSRFRICGPIVHEEIDIYGNYRRETIYPIHDLGIAVHDGWLEGLRNGYTRAIRKPRTSRSR